MTSITCLSGGEQGARGQVEVEAYLCETFALWTLHECDIRIRFVEVGLGIRGVAGHIGEGPVGGLFWRGKDNGRGLWRNVSVTSKGVHEGENLGRGDGREEGGGAWGRSADIKRRG